MNRTMRVTLCSALLMLAACGQQESASKVVEGGGKGAAASGSVMQSVEARTSGALQSKEGEQAVTFKTSDGVVIAGTLYPAGTAAPAVLCLHQWRSDRSEFAAYARTLQGAGFTVLTIDQRGYGGSTKKADGSVVEPGRITTDDIDAAVAFLRIQKSVDGARIGILGSSYGGSNAIIYASDHPFIRTVALLSPGLNYHKVLPTEPAVTRYGKRPLLAIAGSEDMRSVEAVVRFRELAGASMQSQLYDNGGHGVDLLRSHPESGNLILQFFQKNLQK